MTSCERETGFEPATPTLARLYSTPEPLAHIIVGFVSSKLTMMNIPYSLIFVNGYLQIFLFFCFMNFCPVFFSAVLPCGFRFFPPVYDFMIALRTY